MHVWYAKHHPGCDVESMQDLTHAFKNRIYIIIAIIRIAIGKLSIAIATCELIILYRMYRLEYTADYI